jgi:hypothetical protein
MIHYLPQQANFSYSIYNKFHAFPMALGIGF